MPLVLQAAQRASIGLVAEDPPRPRPWETAIVKHQSEVRTAYRTVAAELVSSDDPADKRLGAQTLAFLAGLPSPATRDRQASFDLAAGRRERDQPNIAVPQRVTPILSQQSAVVKPHERDGQDTCRGAQSSRSRREIDDRLGAH